MVHLIVLHKLVPILGTACKLVCTAEECEGTVSNKICIHMHHSAHCEAEASEANNMVVPTIQVIGVVSSIVFFQTLRWLALLLVSTLLVVVSSGG